MNTLSSSHLLSSHRVLPLWASAIAPMLFCACDKSELSQDSTPACTDDAACAGGGGDAGASSEPQAGTSAGGNAGTSAGAAGMEGEAGGGGAPNTAAGSGGTVEAGGEGGSSGQATAGDAGSAGVETLAPALVTEPVSGDPDDPAIWIHPTDPTQSLVLGTDKAGVLYAFDLDGDVVTSVSNEGFLRLNGVDIEYGLLLDGREMDIAVVTDRDAGMLYTFTLPDLEQVDGGGVPAFEGTDEQRAMGVALYKRPADGAVFAIVTRKAGPPGGYLWQYALTDDGSGQVQFEKVREFGDFSGVDEDGLGEIEAVVVDDELGYVYYSDELYGIRKYPVDPDAPDADQELAVLGQDGFKRDREGLSIYRVDAETGYIIASDQQADTFRIFTREGTQDDPHEHELLKVVALQTSESDGSEVTQVDLGGEFSSGLFVAMSDDGTFHYYSWSVLAGQDLFVTNPGSN